MQDRYESLQTNAVPQASQGPLINIAPRVEWGADSDESVDCPNENSVSASLSQSFLQPSRPHRSQQLPLFSFTDDLASASALHMERQTIKTDILSFSQIESSHVTEMSFVGMAPPPGLGTAAFAKTDVQEQGTARTVLNPDMNFPMP